ncbi:hypothetical protein B0H15DRAFT_802836 [Mycena belliarum]|uniref:Uncharacterized protein n=1 Tax=Mycena belliarum TaxID=1033014 RepID=A0AAD6U3H0_9AGAR|nr:hypothetical protein B0H15DRAFT_802836 [Mycena belliae]
MSQIYVLGVPSTVQVMFDIFRDQAAHVTNIDKTQTRTLTNDYCSNTATPPQMPSTDTPLPGITGDLLRPAPTGKFAESSAFTESACCADCANVPTHNELVFLAKKQLPKEGAQWIHIEGINSTQGGERWIRWVQSGGNGAGGKGTWMVSVRATRHKFLDEHTGEVQQASSAPTESLWKLNLDQACLMPLEMFGPMAFCGGSDFPSPWCTEFRAAGRAESRKKPDGYVGPSSLVRQILVAAGSVGT